jgi:hypothetical protein
MQVRQSRTRNKVDHSTWSLVATIAVLVLAIIIIVMHLVSRSVVEEPVEEDQDSVPTLFVHHEADASAARAANPSFARSEGNSVPGAPVLVLDSAMRQVRDPGPEVR